GTTLLAALLYDRKKVWRSLAAAACLPAAVSLWSWGYFGSPIANSTRAKHLVFADRPWSALQEALSALLEAVPFHEVFPLKPPFLHADLYFGVFVWATLIWLGARFLHRRSPAASLVALEPFLVITFYAFANPMLFPWYSCTFVPLATLLALLGSVAASHWLPIRKAPVRHAIVVAVVLVIARKPLQHFWLPFVSPESAAFDFQKPNALETARTFQYANVARWLNQFARPDDR